MQFSNNVRPLFESGRESGIDRLSDPNLIKFSIGNPPDEGFPIERIKKASQELLESDPCSMLSYSSAGGRADLKQAVKNFLNRRYETVRENDEITITGGGQQAIALAVQLFCNYGDIVLCENPTFMAALDTIKGMGGKPVGVKMEKDGIDLEDLEEKMRTLKPRLLYIISDFQNPTGISLPEYKREEICRLAYKYDVPVLEDNPYYELRYDGEFIPFIKHYDQHGYVALTSSMSKIIAPGLRVGYVVAEGEMGKGFSLLKTAVDLHVSTWAQRISCKLLEDGMEDEIAHLRELYGHRGRLMYSLLQKYCHRDVEFTKPQGGMFIWVTMPKRCDIDAFLDELAQKGVMVVPGRQFCPDGGRDCTSFRLSYSLASDSDCERGIKIIGDLTRKYLGI